MGFGLAEWHNRDLSCPCRMTATSRGPSCAVVWLHGMGGTGPVEQEWKDAFGRRARHEMPRDCAWEFPRAPEGPVTFHRGRVMPRWWDTWGDARSLDWVDSPEDVSTSVAMVHTILDNLAADSDRVVVAGFSQGAAMALVAALSYPKRLAGCVMFGGWLSHPTAEHIKSGNWTHSSNARLPVWWGHGARDRSIPSALQARHCDLLDAVRPVAVQQCCYPCGHWPSEQAMKDLLAWIHPRVNGCEDRLAADIPQSDESDRRMEGSGPERKRSDTVLEATPYRKRHNIASDTVS